MQIKYDIEFSEKMHISTFIIRANKCLQAVLFAMLKSRSYYHLSRIAFIGSQIVKSYFWQLVYYPQKDKWSSFKQKNQNYRVLKQNKNLILLT